MATLTKETSAPAPGFDWKRLIPLLGLVIFGVAAWALHHELRGVSLKDVFAALSAVPRESIVAAVVLVVLSYAALAVNDRLALAYIGRSDVPFRAVAQTSFVAYVLSHNVGFSYLSGTPVRIRLYNRFGLSAFDVGKVMAFNGITFWLGFLALGAGSFLNLRHVELKNLGLHLPPFAALGGASLALVLGWLIACAVFRGSLRIGRFPVRLPSLKLALAQTASSAFDWLAVGLVLYCLLPATTQVSFPLFLAVFLTAQIAGLASQVPGGIGIFEGTFVLLLPQIGREQLIGTLLLYRVLYYLLPLAVALMLLAFEELKVYRKPLGKVVRGVDSGLLSFAPALFATTTFLSGLVLLLSGATPVNTVRLHWLKAVVPLPFLEFSHLLGTVAGIGLVVLSRGLLRRVDLAWTLTMLLLAIGIGASLLKGLDYEEALFLMGHALLLFPCRKHFFRRSALLSDLQSSRLLGLAVVSIALAGMAGTLSYNADAWNLNTSWIFGFQSDAPRSLRALVFACGSAFLVVLVNAVRITRKPNTDNQLSEDNALKMVKAGTDPQAFLAFSGDKRWFCVPECDAFIQYGIQGRSWISMGDPIGNRKYWAELIWTYREAALRAGGRAVFYQVRADNLPLYADAGLTLTKLGEEARVNLAAFSFDGPVRKDLRQALRKAEKEGMTFEILLPAQAIAEANSLKLVSDAWLAGAGEKGFSLGRFDLNYLTLGPCAVIRKEGNIVAFANLWVTDGKEELSFDLMRHLPDAPRGLMDFLFARLIEWGRAEGFIWINLGVAPLSGFSDRAFAPVWNRFASFVFRHGGRFYNFQGLRAFKDKFGPEWRPIYLAAPGALTLPAVLADIALLVGGGIKGVIRK